MTLRKQLLELCLFCSIGLLLAAGCGPAVQPPPPDDCPDDPAKTEPGRCGCGVADTDTDLDGTPDCDDTAPFGNWGPAPPVGPRMAMFDALWKDYRENYAGFVTSTVDWDQLGQSLRPQVEAAPTYGEFFRLVRSAFFDLHDAHDQFFSRLVCTTPVASRPPVAWLWSFFAETNLGICLSALEDDTALVYKASATNPAGLRPGDVIIGYDGRDLRQVRSDMLKLPICGAQATHPESNDHLLLEAAAANFHLHQTLQVRRQGSTEVESISTDGLLNYSASDTFCTAQLDVGVARPWEQAADMTTRPPVSWALLPGTNIGYIYVFGWSGSVDTLFLQAVRELWDADGLIVDFRYNVGGNMFLSFPALRELFDQNIVGVFSIGVRTNTTDLRAMTAVTTGYDVTVNAKSFAHPIALLTGPLAASSGDIVGIYLASHPRARRFGRPSMGSACFDSNTGVLWQRDPYLSDLTVYRTPCIGLGANGRPVSEGAVEPEQRVWLTADDVAGGRDSVVEAARTWIQSQ